MFREKKKFHFSYLIFNFFVFFSPCLHFDGKKLTKRAHLHGNIEISYVFMKITNQVESFPKCKGIPVENVLKIKKKKIVFFSVFILDT